MNKGFTKLAWNPEQCRHELTLFRQLRPVCAGCHAFAAGAQGETGAGSHRESMRKRQESWCFFQPSSEGKGSIRMGTFG
jgi:hypothetical protein